MEVPSLLHQSFKKCVFSDIDLEQLNQFSLPVFVEVKTLYGGCVWDFSGFRRKEKKYLCVKQNNRIYYYDQNICPALRKFNTPIDFFDYKEVIYYGQSTVQRKN